ncbi:MAG: hypothetical protein ACI4VK_05940 [Candidatus Coproplasma sp.]
MPEYPLENKTEVKILISTYFPNTCNKAKKYRPSYDGDKRKNSVVTAPLQPLCEQLTEKAINLTTAQIMAFYAIQSRI